jgi:hypothetical protein
MQTKLGYITACIADDRRYSSRIEVALESDGKVSVVLSETSPIGGMDGPGGAHGFRETQRVTVERCPASIVKAVRSVIATEVGDTIKSYGKPTKNFVWVGVNQRGISERLASLALSFATE